MSCALIMAGGTGGHIFPGLAVADELRARGWRVVWLGNPQSMEGRVVPPRGIALEALEFSGLRGKGATAMLLLPYRLLRAFLQAFRAIGRVRPDVVLGLGGYISFPGAMMAVLRGVPLVLHEQNSIAGMANRVLAALADRILAGFPEVLKNAAWVGNPVRADIAALAPPAERYAGRSGPLRVLVVGGSLGAQALNDAVPRALALCPPEARPRVTHQSGERNLPQLRAAYAAAGVEGELVAFIDAMADAYRDADLVICRAGAITVAELAAAGVASVLVPFPHAVDDHQTANAQFLSTAGAAWLIPQQGLTPAALGQLLQDAAREKLCAMAERARALAKPQAARAVADICAGFVRADTGAGRA
ncbi:MAG: undecaprenyldiphospho-muramoylpentapeptide beta-N-acetylglucosaminyltransferase [Rhodocyclaceae bacterium]|nr:undecaprenyldiphospho-muramoylpentapeptide beta-N-acetylglucosaminyltransferase [Rhodocyclaceae bacterium]MBX3670191.1 undecaprenyldiphospho-muramoylpentapeptide beta-N-acetylglucosaminyltransferase [Rhodocyclaceae bacterium]